MVMIDPLSLVDSAQPIMSREQEVEEPSFCEYCMVCDKLISEKVKGNVVPEPVVEEEKPKKPKKKTAGGKVYIKNPDGTILTKTANGTKVTRPGLKRNTSSANRLAAVAADHASTVKLQPLTRSKTMDPAPTQEPVIPRTSSSSTTTSPQSAKIVPSPIPKAAQSEYRSNVYCSLECELHEKGASSATYKEIARSLSYDFSSDPRYALEGLVMQGLSDQSHYAPPSPLFVSGSDTESSSTGQDGPACSAPNTLGFFRVSREGPDDAWNDVQRQRRSSMAPAIRPVPLARHRSNVSTQQGWGDVSSDSLSSLWNTNSSEHELDLSRSVSNGPKARNVSFAAETERAGPWTQRRSLSHTSQRSAPLAMGRPSVSRSGLSQTSLTASPSRDAIGALDAVSKGTVELLHSYNAAFPIRDATGTSSSYKQKGFVLPGSVDSSTSTPSTSRRASVNATLQRNPTGTIRVKKQSEPTWDSFGRQEIYERQTAALRRASSHEREQAQTPKQTLAKVDGKWTVVYGETSPRPLLRRSVSRGSEASRKSSDSRSTVENRSPRPSLGTSLSSNGHGRTPVAATMPPPSAIPVRQRRDGSMTPSSSVPSRTGSNMGIPDLSSLRIGSSGCAPYLNKESVVHRGFDWTAHEQKGGKTYALPPSFKADRVGLFYFQN